MTPDKLTEALKDLDRAVVSYEQLGWHTSIESAADDLAESARHFLNLLDDNFKETN